MAQLKMEMTSDGYDSLHQEPMYQRITNQIIELNEVTIPTHQATLKISQQAPGTPPPAVHQHGPAYENIARKLSFHSDEEEGFFELDIEGVA